MLTNGIQVDEKDSNLKRLGLAKSYQLNISTQRQSFGSVTQVACDICICKHVLQDESLNPFFVIWRAIFKNIFLCSIALLVKGNA